MAWVPCCGLEIDPVDGLFEFHVAFKVAIDADGWGRCLAGWSPRYLTPDPRAIRQNELWSHEIRCGYPGDYAMLSAEHHSATAEAARRSVTVALRAIIGNGAVDEALAFMKRVHDEAKGEVWEASLSFSGDGWGMSGPLDATCVVLILRGAPLEFARELHYPAHCGTELEAVAEGERLLLRGAK